MVANPSATLVVLAILIREWVVGAAALVVRGTVHGLAVAYQLVALGVIQFLIELESALNRSKLL